MRFEINKSLRKIPLETSDRNRNRNLSKVNVIDKLDENRKNLPENSDVNQSEEIKNKD